MSPSSAFKNQRFHVLDGMRGIAAIVIMFYHYNMRQESPFLHFPYIAVDFFFILSGFVLMHSYGDRIRAGMTAETYLLRRWIRLYPLMTIGILLGLPGLWFFTDLGHTDFSHRDIVASVVSNLGFMPFINDRKFIFSDGTVVGELFPTDGPLWSIFFEAIASIAFVYFVKQSRGWLLKFCGFCFLAVVVDAAFNTFVDHGHELVSGFGWGSFNMLGGFPRVFYGFVCGMVLYQLRSVYPSAENMFTRHSTLGCLLLYFILLGCLLFPFRLDGFFYLVAVGVIAPAIVWFGSGISKFGNVLTWCSEVLGWLSYAIYCIHKPIIMAAYWLNEKYDLQAYTGFSIPWQGVIVTIPASIVLTVFVDEPLRAWLTSRFVRKTNSLNAAKHSSFFK